MSKKTIRDLDVAGKRVFVRCDFNVPQDKDGNITDDTRIQGALPTLKALLEAGASLILASHLGRPKGEKNLDYSLAPVAKRLSELLGKKVAFADDCVGETAEKASAALAPGDVLLLENVRFHAGETANDPAFAASLGKLADVFVNDAFGTAHRAHASTAGIAEHVSDSAIGMLMELELEFLVKKLESPAKPFVVIMGGAKVSDKIQVINTLMEKADTILIGGAMAYTFLKALGHDMGMSRVEKDKLELALEILENAKAKGVKFLLPVDTRVTSEFADDAPTEVTAKYSEGGSIPADKEGIDIGPATIEIFEKEIATAGTVIWNGPMGVFEKRGFHFGTEAVAKAVAESPALTIIGGGDSVTAVNKFGYADQMTFNSTGGGASLELLEGKVLPGVAAIADA